MKKSIYGFSKVRVIVTIIIIGIIIAVLIPTFKALVFNDKISKANTNAQDVYASAEKWLTDAKNSGTYSVSSINGDKLIFKSESAYSKKSAITIDNNFVSMDLTSYLDKNFTGDWYAVVDAYTFKIEYALWSKNTIPDDKLKQIDSILTQQKEFKPTNIIGCYPIAKQ